ncbi:MAG: SIMPL domain-containing protein [Myxococcota bacterium]
MRASSVSIKLLVATLLIAPLAFAQSPAPDTTSATLRTLSVTGYGEVMATPDLATVAAGVETQAPTAAEALEENNRRMEALIAALTGAGVAREDIQTAGFSVYPVYAEVLPGMPPKIDGYNVSNIVVVKVRRLDGLGALLDQLVNAGANTIHGVAFGFSNPQQMMDQARERAMADADRVAQHLARLAGAQVEMVLSISESTIPPIYGGRGYAAADAAAVPVEPGQSAVSTTVQVTYTLR